MTKLEKLQQIETELSQIIHKDRKNWFRAAKLLIKIEKEKLYQLKAHSFTQYVKKLAVENNINVSTLWRAKSAAMFYAKLLGTTDIETIHEKNVKTTPEQLEYFARVQTIVPSQIVSSLQEKMLRGESIRNELHHLWKMYRPLKHGKTERGRKSNKIILPKTTFLLESPAQYFLPLDENTDEKNYLISKNLFQFIIQDQEKLHKYAATKEELTEVNILNALQSNRWISLTLKKTKISFFQTFTKVEIPLTPQKIKKIDLVAVAQKQEEDLIPFILGVTIRINIDSIQYDHVLQELCQFTNYHYIAIPASTILIEKAKKIIPEHIGILSVSVLTEFTRHQIKIVRLPHFFAPLSANLTTLLFSLLKINLKWKKS